MNVGPTFFSALDLPGSSLVSTSCEVLMQGTAERLGWDGGERSRRQPHSVFSLAATEARIASWR